MQLAKITQRLIESITKKLQRPLSSVIAFSLAVAAFSPTIGDRITTI